MALGGCSGASGEPDGTDQGAVRGHARVSVPDTAAIQFQVRDKRVVLGTKRKVSEALAAFKESTGNEVTPRCAIGPATKLTFFNERAEEIASGSYFCFRGTITLKGESEVLRFYFEPGDLDVKDQPLAVGDLLWDADKVEIDERGEKVELRTPQAVKKMKDAFDLEQEVKPHAGPDVRCARPRQITFFRGHDDIPQATYFCGEATGTKRAKLSAPKSRRVAPGTVYRRTVRQTTKPQTSRPSVEIEA